MSSNLDADDVRSKVSDKDYRRIDAKLTELKRRLNDKRGSLIDPESLLDSLQCLIEGRMVMPGSTAYTVTDGTSDRRTLPFSNAQWAQIAFLYMGDLGCTIKTVVALVEAYGRSANFLGPVLLRTAEEIERDCGEQARKDLEYCLGSQLLQLPTEEELRSASDWWLPLRIYDGFKREVIELRVPRGHLHLVSLKDIGDVDHYLPTRARVNAGITTLGDLLAFDNEQALREAFLRVHDWASGELANAEFSHKAHMIAEWVHNNHLRFAGEL